MNSENRSHMVHRLCDCVPIRAGVLIEDLQEYRATLEDGPRDQSSILSLVVAAITAAFAYVSHIG